MSGTYSYVARCRGCGRLVYASVISDDDKERRREQAKDVAGLIRNGFDIERMTTEEVRKSDFVCNCPKQKPKDKNQTEMGL